MSKIFYKIWCFIIFTAFLHFDVQSQMTDWSFMQKIDISNNPAPARGNYQVLLTINTEVLIAANKMNLDGSDIRFSKNCNGDALYDYWIESGINTSNTQIWVKIDTLFANSNRSIYMFYGNTNASAASDFENTFPNRLIVIQEVMVVIDSVTNYDWIEIADGSRLLPRPGQKGISLNARKIIIAGELNGEGLGHLGGILDDGEGQGKGFSPTGNNGSGAGGGYGGKGVGNGATSGTCIQGNGGIVYGNASAINSIEAGSGGGAGITTILGEKTPKPGGNGGAGFILNGTSIDISGTINVDGLYGTPGENPGGGGSGGGILIKGYNVNLSGTLTANAGNGGLYPDGINLMPCHGGPGGGGRIKVFYHNNYSNAGAILVNGGTVSAAEVPHPLYLGPPGDQGTSFSSTFISDVPTFSFSNLSIVLTTTATQICEGTAANFTADPGYALYNFLLNGTSVQSGASNVYNTSSLAQKDTVWVIAANSGGCLVTSNKIVMTVLSIPVADAGTDKNICEGASAIIGGSPTGSGSVGPYTYLWTPSTGLNNATAANPIASPSASTVYKVTVTANNGCTDTSSIAIGVDPIPVINLTPSTVAICEGDSIQIEASGALTYNWFPTTGLNSGTGSKVTAGPPGTTTYTVTGTSVNGCTGTTNVIVTVNPLPPANAVSNSPICEGDTLFLSTNVINGATYSWTGPNGFVSLDQAPFIPSATSADSGTYKATVTVDGCQSDTASTNVTVYTIPNAPVISSNSPICEGDTVLLTAVNVNNALYSWSGPNGFNSSDQNPNILSASSSDSGIYELTVTVNGCTSDTSFTNVVINTSPSSPIAFSNSPVCEGNDILLNASFISGASYSWTGPNGYTSMLQNPTITASSTSNHGNYNVTATVDGCTSAKSTISVTVFSTTSTPSTASNSPACEGDTLFLSTSTVNGANYSWAGPNGFTSSDQNPIILSATSANSGTYVLTLTVGGCTGNTGSADVIVNARPALPAASNNGPLCAGDTIHLSTTTVSTATYSWTGSNGFASSDQNPVISSSSINNSGIYKLTVTVSGCTSDTGFTNLIIYANPALPSALSNSPLCEGDTILLTTGTVNGASYSWTGPNGYLSSNQNPIISSVSIADSGAYKLVVTVNGCTSDTGSASVIIDTVPAQPAALSNSPVCENDTLFLTTTAVGGSIYSWSGPNGFNSSAQNPSISPVSLAGSGVYNLTVTKNGCVSDTSAVNVIVNAEPALPPIGSNSPLCEDDTLLLTAGTVSNAIYSWIGPNGFVSSDQNPAIPSVTVANAGIYDLFVMVNGCSSETGSVNVIINAIPALPVALSNTPVCENDTLSLSTNLVGGATYSWTGPNGFTSSNQNPVISSVSIGDIGTYKLTLMVNGCISDTGFVRVNIYPAPSAPVIKASDDSICSGSPVILEVVNSASSNIYKVYDSSTSGNLLGNIPLTINPNSTTTYYVLAEDTNGCVSVEVLLTIVASPLPIVDAGPDQMLCPGNTLTLTASGSGSFIWSTGDTSSFINVSPSVSSSYIVYTVNNGCLNLDSVNVTVMNVSDVSAVDDTGTTSFNVSVNIMVTDNDTGSTNNIVILKGPYNGTAFVDGPGEIKYTPANGFSGVDSIIYQICHTDCDAICVTAKLIITVETEIKVPGGFSPNGDGINDVLLIQGVENYPDNSLIIFNRWGDKVFFASPYENDWGGQSNNAKLRIMGDELIDGTYFYIFKQSAEDRGVNGSIELKRR